MVTLCADGAKHKQYVSNIVGWHFVGPVDRSRNEVYCHINQCRTDNRASNLTVIGKSGERLLCYHLGVLKDWGIKEFGAKTRFIPKTKYIGTKEDGSCIEYLYDELLDKYGTGVRSIFRCISGRPDNKGCVRKTAYGMTWRTEPLGKEVKK